MVTMDQTQNGGQWNLLGTFTLDPALNPQVVLSDQANGTVVADAVMVVPSGTSSDRVTYTPTLASAATVDIYAKWTENANRAETVTYRIHHAGGSTDILVNQQQPSGTWYHLGAFAMAPGQNHRVEVEGALEGETVADAMRFVSAGVSAPGISYVHADHLGSPQKMTDSTKAIVWDAVYTPFGQVHSITGTATNNQRFPGQYADAETGYSYNYFRDYDPTMGRYVQSDPSGLKGGLNTYGYALTNPTLYTDFFGLVVLQCQRPANFPFPFNQFDHYWLKTDTREAGMGAVPGEIPGQNQNSNSPGTRVQVIDHSGESEAPTSSCQVVPNLDEDCVNKALASGRDLGRWTVGNQCQSFVSEVIKECSLPPRRIDGSQATP